MKEAVRVFNQVYTHEKVQRNLSSYQCLGEDEHPGVNVSHGRFHSLPHWDALPKLGFKTTTGTPY